MPAQRNRLYEHALYTLLREWSAEKRINQEEIYQGFNIPLEILLLSELAYNGFTSNRFCCTQFKLVGDIKDFLSQNLNAPRNLDGEKVLDAIAIQQGIFVERAWGLYSFSHLTLQEYLAAQYIVRQGLIDGLVEQHITQEHWHEIFLLVAGLMQTNRGANCLLEKIELVS